MSNDKLKPCPFCGGENATTHKGKYLWWVECQNTECRANGGAKHYKKDAIEVWNRRADHGKD